MSIHENILCQAKGLGDRASWNRESPGSGDRLSYDHVLTTPQSRTEAQRRPGTFLRTHPEATEHMCMFWVFVATQAFLQLWWMGAIL